MAQTSTDRDTNGQATKPKRERRVKPVSIQDDGADMGELPLSAQVEASPVDWNALPNFATFTTNPTSRLIKVKDTKTSYIDLKTGDHKTNVISGRVYRVHI